MSIDRSIRKIQPQMSSAMKAFVAKVLENTKKAGKQEEAAVSKRPTRKGKKRQHPDGKPAHARRTRGRVAAARAATSSSSNGSSR